jgi:hypothetical protein
MSKKTLQIVEKRIRIRISEKYLKQNWGFPFLIAFIILLLAAIVSSDSYSTQASSEQIAIYASYALLIGVLLQVTSFYKYSKQ